MKYFGTVFGIDPGSEESAYIRLENEIPVEFATVRNFELIDMFKQWQPAATVVIEDYTPWSQLSRPVKDTLQWIGRFKQELFRTHNVILVERDAVKRHLLNKVSGSDAQIIAEMVRRFGPPGTKKNPNPNIYGISKHEWQALAVAVVWIEQQNLISIGKETVEDAFINHC